MSDWTNLNEIMRDLFVAQGHIVPASLEAFGNSAPPTANLEEETEEAFYKSCGDVDYTKPPDFGLIQEMLNVVKNEKDARNGDNTLMNSNLNPLSIEFVQSKKHETGIVKKKRKEKNVAIKSILQNLEKNSPMKHKDVLNNRINMFRPKCSLARDKRSVIVSSSHSEPRTNNCQYTPSVEANIYYNKYMEKAKHREKIKQDIWTRVEQELKTKEEVQRRRMQERPSSSGQSFNEEVSENNLFEYGYDKVSLQHHRHFALDDMEDCVVCNVTKKHGYSVNGDE